ncbi:hypothetical protein NMY22_g3757 [Coprinellus aureogranulatus]|nr:hypothetical protein NMY22_g3757 [Coprinellus aureogranulatus]
MAAQQPPSTGPRRNPPRLNIINPSISFSQQQAQALFSPALQTAIHTGVGSGFPVQTPMQPFFGAPGQLPNAPPRRGHGHQGRNSISHFPGNPPLATPLGGHFPRPSMMLPNGQPSPLIGVGPPGPGQPLGPIIINNGPPPAGHRPHKRQMSIGGPPKAVLGGPQRKVSPNPSAAAIAAVGAAALKKKIVVNLPQESEVAEEEGELKGLAEQEDTQKEGGQESSTSSSSKKRVAKEWARIPIPVAEGEAILASYIPVPDEELVSREPFPPESWRLGLPDAIDVFLPGKSTWDALKQQVIEAKLEKLGVERGSGASSAAPHIFAPHARAASISSPADPALLLFKLNKLQQTQSAQALSPSIANSTSHMSSPHLPTGITPPPHNRLSPSNLGSNVFQNRHGHTMSLSQPPTFIPSALSPNFNPFGVALGATPADELERPLSAVSDSGIPASQQSSLNAPVLSTASRSSSRPDFTRGFGLDIPEEAEEEAELDEQERKENELRWKRYQEAERPDEEQSEIDHDDAGAAADTEDDGVTDGGDDMDDMDNDGTTVAEGDCIRDMSLGCP